MENQKVFHVFGESYHQMTEVFDFLVCGIVLIDEETRHIVYANSVAKELSQWEDGEIIGEACHEFLCPAIVNHCPMLDQHQIIEFEERILTGKSGSHIPILKRVKRIEIEGHNYILESFTDIRKQKDKLMKLETIHETDALTGLPNRASLKHMVDDMLRKGLDDKVHSLIMVDLDLLKNVNDTYGHQAGDDVLCEFSSILKDSMRKNDVVFRWGGDEFLIFAHGTDSPIAIQIAERLRRIVAETKFSLTGHVTASFGVAQSRKGESFEKWFRRTDFCLSKSKRDGRNRVTDWEAFINLVWSQGEIPWIRILESGNTGLDDEHRYLLKQINGLFDKLNPMPNDTQQFRMIDQFITEFNQHMASEETLFKNTQFPQILHHIGEHVRIKKELNELQMQLRKGLTDYFSIVDYVVREVFVYHMTMEDTKFFPYLQTRES